jgi:hypothetical protein
MLTGHRWTPLDTVGHLCIPLVLIIISCTFGTQPRAERRRIACPPSASHSPASTLARETTLVADLLQTYTSPRSYLKTTYLASTTLRGRTAFCHETDAVIVVRTRCGALRARARVGEAFHFDTTVGNVHRTAALRRQTRSRWHVGPTPGPGGSDGEDPPCLTTHSPTHHLHGFGFKISGLGGQI